MVEAFEDRRWRQHGQPGGGELDCERKPVQGSADLGDDRRVRCIELEVSSRRPRSLAEQDNGFRLTQLGERRIGARQRERGHRPGNLSDDTQRLAARGEDAKLRTTPQQAMRRVGARVEQVLAGVQRQ